MGKYTLVLMVGFGIVFSSVRMSMQRTTMQAIENAVVDYHRVNARNIANSGIYVGLQRVTQDNSWRSGLNDVSFEIFVMELYTVFLPFIHYRMAFIDCRPQTGGNTFI